MEPVIIDVREKDEFLAEHIPHSINVPLTDFASHAPGVLRHVAGRPILLMCRSGNRARLAACSLAQLGVKLERSPEVYVGGILRWKEEGGVTATFRTAHLPILRQTHLAAGFLAFLGAALAWFVHPAWIGLSGFVGAGLMVSGLTGFCGMGLLLAKMPWNQKTAGLKKAEAELSGSTI